MKQEYTDTDTEPSLQYRRYFPAYFVTEMIANQNTRYSSYTTLLNAYNTKMTTYVNS